MTFIHIVAILIIFVISSVWLWLHFVKPLFSTNELQQKLKHRRDKKHILQTEKLLLSLFQDVNADALSRQDRQTLKLDEDAFICGEINFLAFYLLLEKAEPKASDIFYDLGSASGKAVFTAAFFFDLSKSCGIELLPTLHETACKQIKKLQALTSTHDRQIASIEFINTNFFNYDFSDGDIIFINATCLSYPTWETLLTKLHRLKPGSRVIVTSKKIVDPQFKIIMQDLTVMSWGACTVIIYLKK